MKRLTLALTVSLLAGGCSTTAANLSFCDWYKHGNVQEQLDAIKRLKMVNTRAAKEMVIKVESGKKRGGC